MSTAQRLESRRERCGCGFEMKSPDLMLLSSGSAAQQLGSSTLQTRPLPGPSSSFCRRLGAARSAPAADRRGTERSISSTVPLSVCSFIVRYDCKRNAARCLPPVFILQSVRRKLARVHARARSCVCASARQLGAPFGGAARARTCARVASRPRYDLPAAAHARCVRGGTAHRSLCADVLDTAALGGRRRRRVGVRSDAGGDLRLRQFCGDVQHGRGHGRVRRLYCRLGNSRRRSRRPYRPQHLPVLLLLRLLPPLLPPQRLRRPHRAARPPVGHSQRGARLGRATSS